MSWFAVPAERVERSPAQLMNSLSLAVPKFLSVASAFHSDTDVPPTERNLYLNLSQLAHKIFEAWKISPPEDVELLGRLLSVAKAAPLHIAGHSALSAWANSATEDAERIFNLAFATPTVDRTSIIKIKEDVIKLDKDANLAEFDWPREWSTFNGNVAILGWTWKNTKDEGQLVYKTIRALRAAQHPKKDYKGRAALKLVRKMNLTLTQLNAADEITFTPEQVKLLHQVEKEANTFTASLGGTNAMAHVGTRSPNHRPKVLRSQY